MENFDKMKTVVVKCIKRHYPDCHITFTDYNKIYKLDVILSLTSKKEHLKCCEIINTIIKLCYIKQHINIRVNGLSELFINLEIMKQDLQILRNTDPICQ